MAANLNSQNISKITDAEKKITGQDNPVKGGPTAQAQSHAGESINSQTLHDITEGEKKITGGQRLAGGPTATAQSILSKVYFAILLPIFDHVNKNQDKQLDSSSSSGRLDSDTISKITAAEKDITGADGPAKGGPTAQAQSHAGETIGSENLHDITEGEKKVTGGERVKGGPTATAQSELAKSRS